MENKTGCVPILLGNLIGVVLYLAFLVGVFALLAKYLGTDYAAIALAVLLTVGGIVLDGRRRRAQRSTAAVPPKSDTITPSQVQSEGEIVSTIRETEGPRKSAINWAAIGVSAVVYWLLQAGWFTVFSQQWQSGLRMSAEQLAAYKAHPNFLPYLIALLCNLLMAFVIARVLALGGVFTLIRGFRIGLLIGLIAAAAMLTEMHFELKPWQFIAVSAGAPLAGCALMGIILGAWKPKTALPD